jgi:hypothetical protein
VWRPQRLGTYGIPSSKRFCRILLSTLSHDVEGLASGFKDRDYSVDIWQRFSMTST